MKARIVSWNEVKASQPTLFEQFVKFVMQRYSEPRDSVVDTIDEHWTLSLDDSGRFIALEDLTDQAFFIRDVLARTRPDSTQT